MGIRVTLDNTLLADTPIGWDDAKIKSKRDKKVRGLFINYTTDLSFWGDGFNYIDNILNQDYCQTIDVLIESDDCYAGTWETEFIGIIQLTQLSKYDVDQRIISTKILDESFDAKIDNNKSLKAFVDVGLSKNSEEIQAASPVDIDFFLPSADFSTYIGAVREGYRVFDCFRFIIDYMTDGQVGFKSDLFSGDYYNWMLFNGKEIRQGTGGGGGFQLEVSFKELFIELHKKTNLSFAIEPSPVGYANQFQLRLEETDFFEQNDAIVTLDNVAEILMSFNKDELYSDVNIGSKSFDDDIVLSYPPLNFKAFKEENYTIAGQCNIDKTLKLVSEYIIDTNIIEDILVNGVDKYDKKTFIVITDGVKAIKYKEYDAPISTGTDTSGTVNKLIDSTANFIGDGVSVGDMAINMLTGLTANVDAIDSAISLSLDTDIFNNGDDYQVRDSPFSYNNPLTNVEVISRFIGGLPNSVLKHIGSGGNANFAANQSTTSVHTSFPITLDPIPYDDDSTPPFFDDGGNYDNVTNFDYTVPSSGLYGFKASTLVRMNGNIGNELISNGDFSAGDTDWNVGSASGINVTQITGGKYQLDSRNTIGGSSIVAVHLRQYEQLNNGHIYVLNFDTDISTGIIKIEGNASPNTITTSGNHTVILDYSTTPLQTYVGFRFEKTLPVGAGAPSAVLTIDNVSLKSTTRYKITQSINRSSSTGVLLQKFSSEFNFPFSINQFQIKALIPTEKTFSTFDGEKITVDISISKESGTSNSVSIIANELNQGTNEIEYTEFETVLTDDGGGDILPSEPTDFPIYKYKFEKAMSAQDFKLLTNNPEKAVLFSKSETNHIFGWRNSIEWDRKTGVTSFELRSKTKINGDC